MLLQPNLRIRDYRIAEKLGEGGMGEVWLAVDENLDRKVAVKVLTPELARDPQLIERFKQEARLQAQLVHSGIVGLHTFFPDMDTFFMIMEYAGGKTLKELIREKGRMEVQEASSILKQLLDAVGYAHTLGIVHRDIKPSNIMIGADGRAKILDFGIAKALGDRNLTRTGAKMGTINYMSPEQVLATKDIDGRTDIYSLGITFYEMVTGAVPISTSTESDFIIMNQIVKGEYEQRIAHEMQEPLRSYVLTLVASDREKRFRTCYAAEEALGSIGPVGNQVKVNPGFAHTGVGSPSLNHLSPKIRAYIDSMVTIPAREFMMGSMDSNGPDYPATRHYVDSFKIGATQVTQELYAEIVGFNPSYFKGNNLPVESVSWYDAMQFASLLSKQTGLHFTLPNEMQWEYACGMSNADLNTYRIDSIGWFVENSNKQTHPVGLLQHNKYRISDMLGNVWEMCLNRAHKYPSTPDQLLPGTPEEKIVLRGGSFLSASETIKVTKRDFAEKNFKKYNIGFRLASGA